MGRRVPSFPVRFELFKPTRFSNEKSVMYFAHEWDAYQNSLHHDDQPTTTPAVVVPPQATTAAVMPETNHLTAQNAAAPATAAPPAISCEPSPLAPISPTSSVPSSTSLNLFLHSLENSPRFLPPLPPLLHLPASRSRRNRRRLHPLAQSRADRQRIQARQSHLNLPPRPLHRPLRLAAPRTRPRPRRHARKRRTHPARSL